MISPIAFAVAVYCWSFPPTSGPLTLASISPTETEHSTPSSRPAPIPKTYDGETRIASLRTVRVPEKPTILTYKGNPI